MPDLAQTRGFLVLLHSYVMVQVPLQMQTLRDWDSKQLFQEFAAWMQERPEIPHCHKSQAQIRHHRYAASLEYAP